MARRSAVSAGCISSSATRAPPTGWPASNGFLGKATDASTGLTDVGARFYDPGTGQFISLDPVLEGSSPQQLSGYSYAGGNPVTFSDPSGLSQTSGGGPPNPCGVDAPASCDPNGGGGDTGGGRNAGGGGSSGSGGGCFTAGCPGYQRVGGGILPKPAQAAYRRYLTTYQPSNPP
jgi:RHS repeat-associated protein